MSRFLSFFVLLELIGAGGVEGIPLDCQRKGAVVKGDFDFGNLVHWALDDLGLALDAEFFISDERAKELLAHIGGARAGQNRTGICGAGFLGSGGSKRREVWREVSGESLAGEYREVPSD